MIFADDRGFPRTLPAYPATVWVYVVGAGFLAVSAIVGGLALLLNRHDDPLGIPKAWLERTPFDSFLVPGLTLVGCFGLGSLGVIAGIFGGRRWAGPAARLLAVGLIGWIVVQTLLLRMVNRLHLLYGGLGAVLLLLSSSRSFRVSSTTVDRPALEGEYSNGDDKRSELDEC